MHSESPLKESTDVRDRLLAARDERFAAHYPALRQMARRRLRQHETFTLLSTTALVHESFLRMSQVSDLRPDDTPAFLAYAGRVMRSVIVDAARARLTLRRGEGQKAVALDEELIDLVTDEPARVIVDLHDALDALHDSEPRLAEVIALKYFGGMTDNEVALALGLGERTVRRDAERAHLMLKALMA